MGILGCKYNEAFVSPGWPEMNSFSDESAYHRSLGNDLRLESGRLRLSNVIGMRLVAH
jgi:hypothetical protein